MQTILGVLLTLGGLAALAFVLKVRGNIAANLGGGATAVVVLGTAVAANVASLFLVGHSSLLLGVCALAPLAYAVVRADRDTALGGPDPARRLAWAVTGVLIVWSASVDLAVGDGIVGGRLFAYVGGLLTWLAVGLIAGTCTFTVRAVCYVGLVLLAAMTVPTVAMESWWTDCHVGDLDKCSFVGALFRGPAESENYVAILATITAAAAQVGFRGRTRIGVVVYCILILGCTGSRTGLLTVAVISIYCLVADRWDRRQPQRRLSVLAAGTISSMAILFAMFQVYTAVPGTLSRRGVIWIAVREALEGWVLTGVGVSKWAALQDIGESPQHFFHSTYALFLFAGGIVSVVLFWLWSYLMLRASSLDLRARSCSALVVLFLVYSQTEVIWNPLAVDGLTWIYLLLMCGGLAALPSAAVASDRFDDDITQHQDPRSAGPGGHGSPEPARSRTWTTP